jgi:hypothetical protein
MENKLKPCQFCKAPPILQLRYFWNGNPYYQVSCSNILCKMYKEVLCEGTKESAIAEWNKRTEEANNA